MSQSFRPAQMSALEFKRWVATAAYGAHITYHVGDIGRDKAGYPIEGTVRFADHTEGDANARLLKQIAHAAMDASDAGAVDLVQRRIGPREFEYIAIRRRAPAAQQQVAA